MFAVLSLPSPLHPAVVHFPIVLILLGSVVALAAAFLRRWQLPAIAAALLVLGAAGTIVAVQTGEHDGETAGETPAIESLLDRHEAWAERTQIAAIVAAVLAAGAAATGRWPAVARTLGAATAIGALAATWCVAETGHYGGQLVYRHGAGVNLAASATTGAPAGQTVEKAKKHGDRDDD